MLFHLAIGAYLLNRFSVHQRKHTWLFWIALLTTQAGTIALSSTDYLPLSLIVACVLPLLLIRTIYRPPMEVVENGVRLEATRDVRTFYTLVTAEDAQRDFDIKEASAQDFSEESA